MTDSKNPLTPFVDDNIHINEENKEELPAAAPPHVFEETTTQSGSNRFYEGLHKRSLYERREKVKNGLLRHNTTLQRFISVLLLMKLRLWKKKKSFACVGI